MAREAYTGFDCRFEAHE